MRDNRVIANGRLSNYVTVRRHTSGSGVARSEAGFMLITVLFVSLVLGILALGTAFTSLIDRQVASRQRVGTEAYYVAQTGMDFVKTALFLRLSEVWSDEIEFCTLPEDVELLLPGGRTLGIGKLSEVITPFDGNGSFRVRFDQSRGYYVLTSVGWLGSEDDRAAQATVQVVATAAIWPFGAWDNAVFTRDLSSATGMTTGTIAAYGSVHIANGDIALDSDSSFDATGSSGVFNNYNGRGTQTNATGQAKLAYGTERAYPLDLCTRLKIEQGDVRVRSAAVGIGAAGDSYDDGVLVPYTNTTVSPAVQQIQSIEGVYLGPGGKLTNQTGGPLSQQAQSQIHTRNGVSEGYGSLHLPFPELPQGFPGGSHTQVELDSSNCAWIIDGVLEIPPDDSVASEPCGDGALSWDGEKLTITQDVALREDVLSIRPLEGGEDALRFSGRGVFRVGEKSGNVVGSGTGRIEIKMQVLPYEPTKNFAVYRDQNGEMVMGDALAFVTAGDIDFTGVTGMGSTVSGLFYAEQTVNLPQQVSIAGSVVGRNVHVQQVPRVLWHPDIPLMAEFLGLPGTDLLDGYKGPWSEVSTEIR